jgi:putative phosphonate metabolism protein
MRYAIYYAPAFDSDLWRFGSSTIGYDAADDVESPPRPVADIDPATWTALTGEPRRYGFHATLKAPFALAEGMTEGALETALAGFAGACECFTLPGLEVRALSRFVALVPKVRSSALDTLAAECVKVFDPFRAPLTEADRARRLKAPLTPHQLAHLERWGYPHVFDDFRFHMTLTGPLPEPLLAPVTAALSGRYRAETGDGPLRIDRIALYRQPARNARFEVAAVFPFGDAP